CVSCPWHLLDPCPPVLSSLPLHDALPIFAVTVAVFFWFLYNKTRHGKYMYAIGGNESAAEVAGVNVAATKIRIYILASCMFGSRSEEHTSELQSRFDLVCRLLLEQKTSRT